jgi:hypothetical protein
MKVQPKTEKQIAEESLMKEGVYSFEIMDALDKKSKAGNEMIELKVRLFDEDGNSRGFITDYLTESVAYKLRHAAVACGLEDAYNNGELIAVDFINKMGDAKVRIRKDKNGTYPDQNVIADYIVKKDADHSDGPPPGHPAADPDVPF